METLPNEQIYQLLDTESYSKIKQKSRILYLYRGDAQELKKVMDLDEKLDIDLNVINLKN